MRNQKERVRNREGEGGREGYNGHSCSDSWDVKSSSGDLYMSKLDSTATGHRDHILYKPINDLLCGYVNRFK